MRTMAISRTWRNWDDESQDSPQETPGGSGQPHKTGEGAEQPEEVTQAIGAHARARGIPMPTPEEIATNMKMQLDIQPIAGSVLRYGDTNFTRAHLSFGDEHDLMNSNLQLADETEKFELNRESSDPDFIIKYVKKQRLMNAISTVFAKIAEDLTGEPVPGEDEWYMEDLLYRSCTHKPINKCKVDYEKERLVLVLDNSPSCRRQSTFFSSVATAALRLNDVDVYASPNASMTAMMNPKTGLYEDLPLEDTCGYIQQQIGHRNSLEWVLGHWARWRERVVVFFGDADGIETICNASRHVRKLYWFNCTDAEYDYDMDDDIHDVELYFSQASGGGRTDFLSWKEAFVGEAYTCKDEDDFMELIKKVRI